MMEKKYVDIYHFQVLDAVQNGNRVYMLDKYEQDVCCVNRMSVGDVTEILAMCEANEGTPEERRFLFWYVKEETENESV